MKKDTHPKYQKILFVDSSTGRKFVCGAAMEPTHTEKFEGEEYPAVHVSISSYSHPFFSGQQGLVDTEGRIDKFRKRYAAKPELPKEEPKKEEPKKKAAPKKKPAAK